MGSQSKYDTRTLRYVPVKPIAGDTTGETVKYAFVSNTPQKYQAIVGHVPVSAVMMNSVVLGLVLGCSYPKPGRAGKKLDQRYVSTYFDQTKKLALKKDGWRLAKTRAKPQYRNPANSGSLVQTVFVTINGINYAWNPPKVTITNVTPATITALGIKTVVSDIADLTFGADFPKPPRFSKTLVEGDSVKVISSFYDPSVAALPAGLDSAGSALTLLANTGYTPATAI